MSASTHSPVLKHHFDRRIVLWRNLVGAGLLHQPQDATKSHKDVDAVDACHDVVEAEEQPHLAGIESSVFCAFLDLPAKRGITGQNAFAEVRGVLEPLQHHERSTERKGDEQIAQ